MASSLRVFAGLRARLSHKDLAFVRQNEGKVDGLHDAYLLPTTTFHDFARPAINNAGLEPSAQGTVK